MSEYLVVNPGNPRRRRRRKATSAKRRTRARAKNPGTFRKRRTRRRRNPAASFGGSALNLHSVGFGVAGAVGVELGGAAIARVLPANLSGNKAAMIGMKGALVFLAPMLLKRFIGAQNAKALAVGAGIAVGVEAINAYVMPMIPGASALMSDYLNGDSDFSDGMADYLQGSAGEQGVTMFAPQWGG